MNNKILSYLFKNKNLILIVSAYSISFLAILLYLAFDIIQGGGGYKQGDWLINNELVEIRRGFFGSLILYISNLLNFNPLYILSIIQITILFLIYITFICVGIQLKNNDVVFFLLFSPFFILFWFNDPAGSMRKEIIAYLAFIPFLIAALRENKNITNYILLSVFIYLIAVFSHEANIFFFPFFVAAIYIIRKKIDKFFIIFSLVYALISVLGFLYAIRYPVVEDYMLVCQPLLDQGLSSSVCHGAITWLSLDSNYALSKTKELLFSKASLNFLISYIFSLLFFVYILKEYFSIKNILMFCLVSSFCFSPLWIVALDWGRWINFYVVSLTFLLLIYFLYNKDNFEYTVFNKSKFIFLLIFCSLFSMPHWVSSDSESIHIFHGYIYTLIKMGYMFFVKIII